MMDKLISIKMNKFIRSIHKNFVIIYKMNGKYYSIDQDVYVYKAIFAFKYCYRNNRMIISITKDYLNYILKIFREHSVNYCIISINHGYDKTFCYHRTNNHYYLYYKNGKRIIKNEKKINKLLYILHKRNDINLLGKVDDYLNGCN